jgi:hypothetical protein
MLAESIHCRRTQIAFLMDWIFLNFNLEIFTNVIHKIEMDVCSTMTEVELEYYKFILSIAIKDLKV